MLLSHICRPHPELELKKKPGVAPEPLTNPNRANARTASIIDLRHLWAYARREAMEILRDPIRLTFSLLGPILLLVAFGYGISFDVDNLAFAAFDQDRTLESLQLIEDFSGSRYFQE